MNANNNDDKFDENVVPVQGTGDDAAVSKLSCAKLGYINDPYIEGFVKKSTRRSPLINRGYYARVAAVAHVAKDFITTQPDIKKQIVCLGSGFDTLYFRLQADGLAPHRYYEVDYYSTQTRKLALIKRHPKLKYLLHTDFDRYITPLSSSLSSPLSPLQSVSDQKTQQDTSPTQSQSQPSEHIASGIVGNEKLVIPLRQSQTNTETKQSITVTSTTVSASTSASTSASNYYLLAGDLSQLDRLEQTLIDAGVDFSLPTLFISECVLVYMKPDHSDAIIEWVGKKFEHASFIIYEQIHPHDPFGITMMQNLQSRGCDLYGLERHPDLPSQEKRFLSCGWSKARACNMNDVYRKYIPRDDVQRIERLELFDEFEEWHLIQGHYCLVVASKDPQDHVICGALSFLQNM